MITMAADLKGGVFYRPLFDSVGYGGTRYFPLYFCLHALLLKLGMPVLLSAYLLSTAAIIGLMLGTFRLLRESGWNHGWLRVRRWRFWPPALFRCPFPLPRRMGWLPPSTSGAWQRSRDHRAAPDNFLASLLFTLAWSAKLTTVFGLAAALIWLLAMGYKRFPCCWPGKPFAVI